MTKKYTVKLESGELICDSEFASEADVTASGHVSGFLRWDMIVEADNEAAAIEKAELLYEAAMQSGAGWTWVGQATEMVEGPFVDREALLKLGAPAFYAEKMAQLRPPAFVRKAQGPLVEPNDAV